LTASGSAVDAAHHENNDRRRTENVNDYNPPNIILFMTDDQDVTANSLDSQYMPRLNKLFRNEGMEFHNYYVSTGLCCPSRATILRGQYCHNTKIWDNGE
jgi:arylsulfatase A-like enzyme